MFWNQFWFVWTHLHSLRCEDNILEWLSQCWNIHATTARIWNSWKWRIGLQIVTRDQTWLGYPFMPWESTPRIPKFTFFSFFPWFVLHFTLFSIIFTYESENSKIYAMWAMFYQWPKNPKNLTFWNFLHCNRAFGSCHIHAFYTH
jgi:hypothetical protein